MTRMLLRALVRVCVRMRFSCAAGNAALSQHVSVTKTSARIFDLRARSFRCIVLRVSFPIVRSRIRLFSLGFVQPLTPRMFDFDYSYDEHAMLYVLSIHSLRVPWMHESLPNDKLTLDGTTL